MMIKIFDGKQYAASKEAEIKQKVAELAGSGTIPTLASFLVGDDPGSKLYVGLKQKAAERVGARLEVVALPADVLASEIVDKIAQYNVNPMVHGIMVQLPLPGDLDQSQDTIINTIAPGKDVDGMLEDSVFVTPAVAAALEILGKSGAEKNSACLVVGAKGFVGRRLVNELSKDGWSVEGVDAETSDLGEKTRQADVLVTATGQPNLVSAGMVREGAALIDVGAPVGDIQKAAYEKASFVSPVPGGVGPVTIACLLENLVASAAKK